MSMFTKVKITRPKGNAFDLSHEKKLSCNMGNLVPILIQEVVPGDRFKNYGTEALVRFAPMVAPVMHRINVFTHYFFVPNRLVYEDWEKFITGGETGNDMPAFPKITFNEANRGHLASGNLADYFGIPTVATGDPAITRDLSVSALPFRAYQLIYNEYYRDQNLTPKIAITKNGTVDSVESNLLLTMRKRAWEKDYFTSALPWSQRGNEVGIPNSVNYLDQAQITYNGQPTVNGDTLGVRSGDGKLKAETQNLALGIENIDTNEILVNDLRRAVRLQEWLEKNARAGSRYIEQILSHFGVASSDARLQRPEFLAGGKNPVVISEVLSTFNNTEVAGATMYGHGVSSGAMAQFNRSFEEHGYIIGILSVLPKTAYSQGVDKSYLKFDKFDYFWPEFAQLGEQPILNKELYQPWHGPSTEDQTFGYTPRYAEYKYKPSTVHGEFRKTLDFWHMGRTFTALPALNTAFIEADPTHRIFADTVESDHKLYIQLYNNLKAIRPMPRFNTPTI